MIRWAMGYDAVEAGAYYTMCHSLNLRSSEPISITPVALSHLKGILSRDRDPKQSNDFAFSRWLVPWIFGYEGWAVFSDCDMILLDDPAKLWSLRDDRYAIQCVQHDFTPRVDTKFLGTEQTRYDRKCWSSLMLMNCSKLEMLTPEYVNTAPGLDLHQFKYLGDELIGEIPRAWNKLVGYDKAPAPSLVHWTEGGPYFRGYEDVDHAREYWETYDLMTHVQDAATFRSHASVGRAVRTVAGNAR